MGGWLGRWVGVSCGTWVSVFVPVGGDPVVVFWYSSDLYRGESEIYDPKCLDKIGERNKFKKNRGDD